MQKGSLCMTNKKFTWGPLWCSHVAYVLPCQGAHDGHVVTERCLGAEQDAHQNLTFQAEELLKNRCFLGLHLNVLVLSTRNLLPTCNNTEVAYPEA